MAKFFAMHHERAATPTIGMRMTMTVVMMLAAVTEMLMTMTAIVQMILWTMLLMRANVVKIAHDDDGDEEAEGDETRDAHKDKDHYTKKGEAASNDVDGAVVVRLLAKC